ncbi:DUF4293 domain-containing protein [Flavobacteriaceae bacterium F08102]|nr:DUF4293 domain-containing protein [Flavobacteriaceae bacterium F08102]
MIQRVQTLYLILAAICSLGLTTILTLWKGTGDVFAMDLLKSSELLLRLIPVFFIISGLMSVLTIGLFKKRKRQFVLNRLNILINFFLLGILIYYLLTLSGDAEVSEKGIGVFLPIVNIVLLVLANKAIQKDENLVKSVDRLR